MATENDKVNTGALATLVAVGVFATLAVALGVDALVRYESGKVQAERAGHAEGAVRELAKEQRAQLEAQPLPIDRAMAAVVRDLRQNPWSATPAAPEQDAGADAATAPEAVDAGDDAAVAEADAAAPAPETPPAPSAAPAAPEPKPTTAPKAPAPTAPVTAPTTAKAPAPAPTTAAAPKPATPAAPAAPAAPAPAAPSPKPTDG